MQLKVFRKIQVVVHYLMYSNKHVIYIYILDDLTLKIFSAVFYHLLYQVKHFQPTERSVLLGYGGCKKEGHAVDKKTQRLNDCFHN